MAFPKSILKEMEAWIRSEAACVGLWKLIALNGPADGGAR